MVETSADILRRVAHWVNQNANALGVIMILLSAWLLLIYGTD